MEICKIHISIPQGLLGDVDRALADTRERLAMPRLSRSDFICMHLAGALRGYVVDLLGPQQTHAGATADTQQGHNTRARAGAGVVVEGVEKDQPTTTTDDPELRHMGDPRNGLGSFDAELLQRFKMLAYPRHPNPEAMLKNLFSWVSKAGWKPSRVDFCLMKTLENEATVQQPVGYFRKLLETVSGGDVEAWVEEKRKASDPVPPPTNAKRFGGGDDIPF